MMSINRLKEVVALCTVIGWALLLGVTTTHRRPDLLYSADYLFGDQGVNLLVAETILSGGLPYQDVAYPYGPLPAYIHTGFAALFGNSIATYLGYMQTFSLLHLVLLYLAVRRFYSQLVAGVVCVLAFTPTMLIPGALFGAYTNAAYIPVERCLLTGLLLVYVAPARRSFGRAAMIGLIFGVLQFTKFASCVFAGGALVVLDLLLLWSAGSGCNVYRHWIRISLTTLCAFAAVESVRVGLAFTLLTPEIAWDMVWPAFAGQLYITVPLGLKRPGWVNAAYFVGQQLTPVAGLIISAIGLVQLTVLTRRDSTSVASRCGDQSVLLLLPLFYGLCAVAYFGHVHTYIQYGWCLMLGVPYTLARVGLGAKCLATVVALPCVLMTLKVALFNPTLASRESFRLPNGEVLFMEPTAAAAVVGIHRECEQLRLRDASGRRERLLIYPQGAGYHYFFRSPRVSRHVWYIPYYVRPYDAPAIAAALDTTLAIVVMNADDLVTVQHLIDQPMVFPPDIARALLCQLGQPVAVTPNCAIFPIGQSPK
jgi:hypothetical protein